MVEQLKDRLQEEPQKKPERPKLKDRLLGGISKYSREVHDRALRAIDRVKATALRKFPYKVDDVPEGESGIDWILQHRAEVFPSVQKEIQFDNGGAPSPSKFYTEAAAEHSRYTSEVGYGHWGLTHKKLKSARDEVAKLINCNSNEVAFEENTVEGVRNIVEKFDWKPGDKVVVLKKDKEYPSNHSPWAGLARFGVELIEIGDDDGIVTPEEIETVLSQHPEVRLVTLSTVGWKTGQRIDLEKVGQVIAQRNSRIPDRPKTRFFVDAIQSLGQHDVDVKKSNIDYLAAGGSKWLMAGSGRGIFYCSKDGMEDIRKEGFGASSQKIAVLPGSELKKDAEIFEEGMKNFDASIGLGESVRVINRIGIKNIEKRVAELTDILCRELANIGYVVTSPRDEKSKSGIVLFKHPSRDSMELNDKLESPGNGQKPIWMSIRDGKMRACVHYYNTREEIDELIHRLSREESLYKASPDYLRKIAKDKGFYYGGEMEEVEQAIQSAVSYCKQHEDADPEGVFHHILKPAIQKKSEEIYQTLQESEQKIFDDFLTDSPGRAIVQKLRKLKYAEKIRQKMEEAGDTLDGKTLLYMGSGNDLGLAMLTGAESISMVDPMLDAETIRELVAKVKKYDSTANYDEGENALSFEFYGKKFNVKFYGETMEQFNERGDFKADIAITHSGQPYFKEQEVRKSMKEKSLFFEVQQQ